jgi:hypothetical protein
MICIRKSIWKFCFLLDSSKLACLHEWAQAEARRTRLQSKVKTSHKPQVSKANSPAHPFGQSLPHCQDKAVSQRRQITD